MAETKTKATEVSVDAYIDAVENPVRRGDAKVIRAIMERISGKPATMWGPSIIGFGEYSYKYESGHGGTACRMGFSPRKAELVLYVLAGRPGLEDELARVGKHKAGKGCLYIKKLADVDLDAVEVIARGCWDEMSRRYPD